MLTLSLLRQTLSRTTAQADWLTQLVEDLSLPRDALLAQAAECIAYPVCDAALAKQLQPALDVLPYTEMARRRVLLGRDNAGSLCAIFDRPLDTTLGPWLRQLGQPVQAMYLADPLHLHAVLQAHESQFSAVSSAVGDEQDSVPIKLSDNDLTLSRIENEQSPAIRLVNSTVFDALRAEASDIHIESLPQGLAVKFRIDGVLNRIATVTNTALAEQAIARIKVLAELDIAEQRIPQDGRFRVATQGRDIDIRVSIMPSIHGEDAVLRILDKQALIDQMQQLSLDTLGFDAATLQRLRKLASEPYGMLLVTGPTGSGKTTTLYAALPGINTGEDKIVTIEDPVEYQLPGVLQIPVNEKKGLTFAVGLRSILRHDPDKILVGEIRDPETAQIAVQSALTGHLVFTSVHANNTFDVIGRFLHMGIDPHNFVSSLSGVVAQRLIRQNCPVCTVSVTPDTTLLAESGICDPGNYAFQAGPGCKTCRGTGFRGRRAIAEVLRLTDDMRELILTRAPARALKEQARQDGTRFLREVALDLVKAGQTTLQEVNRVTFVA
ncbi:MAG: type II/IV secretion system protein [Elusimicrobia bacterium]|nr:MAG: type II/IV secretion system protein [Elusimicrobiota bacterium]